MAEFERVPDEESLQIDNIVKLTIAQLKNRYPNNEPIRRGVHPKDHGCVTAKFTVKESLEKEFCVGVFANPGQRFDALIRFSNAALSIDSDSSVSNGVINHGSRGMAVKLLGVMGTPLLPMKGPLTQDFLMINQPVFAFPNVEEYEALSQILLKDKDKPARYFAERIHRKPDGNPDLTDPITQRALRTFGIVRRIASAIVTAPPSVPPAPPTPTAYQPPPISPVDNRYFSGAPFLFGDDRVMKFSAKPIPSSAGASGSPSESDIVTDPNYLRKGLRNRLAGGDDTQNIVFEFQVQVRDATSLAGKIDAEIEDVCVEWKEEEHPFVTVATIVIPPQEFDSAERQTLCEDLIFSPWHGLVEHRPLGGINRLRRAVYETSVQLRHAQPTPTSIRCPHIK